MNGWVKNFADGTSETGDDQDVNRRIASWRRGRLDKMIGAELHYNDMHIYLDGEGEYWQSDDYDVTVFEPTPVLATRRIQKKIHWKDNYLHSSSMLDFRAFSFTDYSQKWEMTGYDRRDKVPERAIGKWFTIEYDVKKKTVIYSYQENRI